ncbi:hypothetical protein ASG20_14240 [Sphingomonas sp. Leaf198]|nr:hypothetical protein ASG20_14240 [Sphingomonas sp. Leaf198]
MPSFDEPADCALNRPLRLAEFHDEVRYRWPRLALVCHERQANQHRALMLVEPGNVVSITDEIETVSHKSAFRAMRDTAAGLRPSSDPIALPIVVIEIADENGLM